jgi:ATP-dependent Clp protease ATP-binding subunit ClpC
MFQAFIESEKTVEQFLQDLFGCGSEVIALPDFFGKCTPEAIEALQLAKIETRRLGLERLRTEQLLLGLIGAENGIAEQVLKVRGVTQKQVRAEVIKRSPPQEPGEMKPASPLTEVSFSADANQTLKFASEAAARLEHGYIGTEHLLLGLLQVYEGGAIEILHDLKLNLSDLQQAVLLIAEQLHP